MNQKTYQRKENAIYRLQEQLESHTDEFWNRFVKIAKEVCGDFYNTIKFESYGSDNINGIYKNVKFQGISYEPGKSPMANLQGRDHFRGNEYGYYYYVPEEMFWSDDDSLIRSFCEQKLTEHKDNLVKKAEIELNRKKQDFERLKKELETT